MNRAIATTALIAATGISLSGCGVYPPYRVWASENNGKAQLAEANSSKQIAVQQSKAKAEAAAYEKQAEITRAEGAAAAIKITGDALQQHPEYLRYLYVNNLAETKNQVIHIPTEAGLPILEAGGRMAKAAPQ